MTFTGWPTLPQAANIEALTSAVEAYVGDAVGAGAWTAYTPTWTATTSAPAIGNGTRVGAYIRIGRMITFRARIVMGSTTTFGSGQYSLGLPVAPAAGPRLRLPALLYDVSAGGDFDAVGLGLGGSTVVLGCQSTTAGAKYRAVEPAVPFTFAAGDSIDLAGTYEATA